MIYLVIILGIVLSAPICNPYIKIKAIKKISGTKFYIVFWGTILVSLVALRSINVGNDTVMYEFIFNDIKNCNSIISWMKSAVYTGNTEYGYYFLCFIISRFADFRFFMILTAILTISPFMYLIYKESKNIPLSLILFIGLPYYTFFMSGMRQAYALALIVPAYYFMKKKNLTMYIATIMLAYTFHTSSLIFLPVYWIGKIKNTAKTRTLLAVAIVLFWIFRNQIWSIAFLFARQQYGANDAGGEMMCVFLVLSAILGFYYRRNFLDKNNGEKELFYLQVLTAMIAPFSLINSALYRIYFYFNIFIIIYVPTLVRAIKEKNERYIIVGGYVFVSIMFLLKIVMNPEQHYYPYYFMWQ